MSRVSYDLFNDSVDKIAAGGWNKIKRVGKNFVKTLKGENVNQAQQALDAGNKKYQGIIDKWEQNQKNIDALKSKADNWREVKPLSFWDRTVNKVKGDEVYNWLNKVEAGESQLGKQNILDKIKMLQDKSSGIAGQAAHAEGKLQSLEEALKSARSNTFATRLATGGVVAAVPGTYLASKALSNDKEKESSVPGSDLWNKFKNNPDAQKAGIGAALGGLTGAGLGYLTEGSGKGAVLGGLAGAGFGGYSGYNYDRMFGDKSSAATYSPYLTDKIAGPRWDSIKRFGNLVTGRTLREAGKNYSQATAPIAGAISGGEAQIAAAEQAIEALNQQKVKQLVLRGKLRSSIPQLPSSVPEGQYQQLQNAQGELKKIADAKRTLAFQGGETPVLNTKTGPGWFADIYTGDPSAWEPDKQVSLEGIYRQYLKFARDLKGLPKELAALEKMDAKSDTAKTLRAFAGGLPFTGFPGTDRLTQPQITALLKQYRIPDTPIAEMFDSGKARLNYFKKLGVNTRTPLSIGDMSRMLSGVDEANVLSELAKLDQRAQGYKKLLTDKAKITSRYNRYLKDKQNYTAKAMKWDEDMKAAEDELNRIALETETGMHYKDLIAEQNKQLADAINREQNTYNKVYSDTINARAKAVAGALGLGAAGLGTMSAFSND